ncbi:MAG: dTDP-4-dehydrorhamnose 3,5-epimerase [Bacteroidota bacterium]
MKISDTPIGGLKIIEPDVFSDPRGYFFESYHTQKWLDAGVSSQFVQDNESMSSYGVIRGLHYQLDPWSQAKLVRVISGSVFDVAVDLRRDSPTFGKWFGIELTGGNKLQLFIPRGFAHGFSVLSPTAVFAYKCDQVYQKAFERAIRFDDPALAIDWKIEPEKQLISEKDRQAPLFSGAEMNF